MRERGINGKSNKGTNVFTKQTVRKAPSKRMERKVREMSWPGQGSNKESTGGKELSGHWRAHRLYCAIKLLF